MRIKNFFYLLAMTESTPDSKLRVSSKSLGIRPSASSFLLIFFNFSSTADCPFPINLTSISFRFSVSSPGRSLSCPPCEKLQRVRYIDHGVHKKYPCLKLAEKLYTLILNLNFLLICVLSNDEHDCTFCICMRSDKLRHERKMIRELRY